MDHLTIYKILDGEKQSNLSVEVLKTIILITFLVLIEKIDQILEIYQTQFHKEIFNYKINQL